MTAGRAIRESREHEHGAVKLMREYPANNSPTEQNVTDQIDDEVLDALDALVDALSMTAGQIDVLVRRVGAAHAQRANGVPYSEILSDGGPLVPEIVTDMLTELVDASSLLRRAEAKALYAEGLSMDSIARLFQVSRQRVSALLRAQMYRSRR